MLAHRDNEPVNRLITWLCDRWRTTIDAVDESRFLVHACAFRTVVLAVRLSSLLFRS
jgi:hypothetical protein